VCGLKFGVFVSSSFFEGGNQRKLHYEKTWCSLFIIVVVGARSRGPPLSPSRCSVFSSLFYLVFVRREFCFRKLFFSWKGLVKRERERERERRRFFFLMRKQKNFRLVLEIVFGV